MNTRRWFIFVGVLIMSLSGLRAAKADYHAISDLQKNMIWAPQHVEGGQAYVLFRKQFSLNDVNMHELIQIFADSRYLLWLNGEYVSRGPVRFNPQRPTYDEIPIGKYLRNGLNTLVVLVHTYGKVINGRIMQHTPGLTVAIRKENEVVLVTDTTWKCMPRNRYQLSRASWNSIPDKIDARVDNEEWLRTEFDDTHWLSAVRVDGRLWGTLCLSDIPLCQEKDIERLKIMPTKEDLTFPYLLKAGERLVLDLGRMSMAYFDLELTAEASDTLSVQYALRYKGGEPSETFGAGNLLITRQGRQHFMTTDQWCCRYVTITPSNGNVLIHGLTFTERNFPYQRKGSFTCNDTLLNKLWEMGVRTIEATADDAFGSDARERNEWIQDAHKASFHTASVALSSPQANDKIDVFLLKSMLRHAAQSQHPDGMLSATFPTDRGPSDCHYVIEDYACQWIEALAHYYDITHDKDFVKEYRSVLERLLGWFLNRITGNGLVYAREYASFDNPMAYLMAEGATLNAYLYHSLILASKLMKEIGVDVLEEKYMAEANKLKTCYNTKLWDEKEQAYSAGLVGDEVLLPSVHAQVFALYAGIVPADRMKSVRAWLLKHYKNGESRSICKNERYKDFLQKRVGIGMPVTFFWLLDVLYEMDTLEMDTEIIEEIRRRWFYMVSLQHDAGTLSESFVGSDGKGSHESCHNYGAVPVYYLSSYVLGVRTDSKKMLIEPRLGLLLEAEGKVVTPWGIVEVSWMKKNERLEFSILLPEGVEAELRLPFEKVISTLYINGEKIFSKGQNLGRQVSFQRGRWLVLPAIKGKMDGCIL